MSSDIDIVEMLSRYIFQPYTFWSAQEVAIALRILICLFPTMHACNYQHKNYKFDKVKSMCLRIFNFLFLRILLPTVIIDNA